MCISKKFTLLYFICLIQMLIIGGWINSINDQRIDSLVKKKYLRIANQLLLNFNNEQKLNELIKEYNLEPEDKEDDKIRRTFYYQKQTFGYILIQRELFSDGFLIHINFLDENLIFETPYEEGLKDKYLFNFLTTSLLILLIFIYVYTLKLLKPLRVITEKIENFSKGRFDTRVEIKSNDEIGVLGNSFNSMASKLQELINTREELLRHIAHELRTPITKGKFAIEKMDDFSQKELLQRVFKDLETLTNELIELEKLNSNSLNVTHFDAETLILEALNKLYIEDESSINLQIDDNFKIDGDIHYLCMALKNLIDNALKYSTKLPISISIENRSISINNYGVPLSKKFDYYLKPFVQENSSKTGFGLGLSIVDKIIKKHSFTLNYKYIDGQNSFILDFK